MSVCVCRLTSGTAATTGDRRTNSLLEEVLLLKLDQGEHGVFAQGGPVHLPHGLPDPRVGLRLLRRHSLLRVLLEALVDEVAAERRHPFPVLRFLTSINNRCRL